MLADPVSTSLTNNESVDFFLFIFFLIASYASIFYDFFARYRFITHIHRGMVFYEGSAIEDESMDMSNTWLRLPKLR